MSQPPSPSPSPSPCCTPPDPNPSRRVYGVGKAPCHRKSLTPEQKQQYQRRQDEIEQRRQQELQDSAEKSKQPCGVIVYGCVSDLGFSLTDSDTVCEFWSVFPPSSAFILSPHSDHHTTRVSMLWDENTLYQFWRIDIKGDALKDTNYMEHAQFMAQISVHQHTSDLVADTETTTSTSTSNPASLSILTSSSTVPSPASVSVPSPSVSSSSCDATSPARAPSNSLCFAFRFDGSLVSSNSFGVMNSSISITRGPLSTNISGLFSNPDSINYQECQFLITIPVKTLGIQQFTKHQQLHINLYRIQDKTQQQQQQQQHQAQTAAAVIEQQWPWAETQSTSSATHGTIILKKQE